jgi:hypothetical protein
LGIFFDINAFSQSAQMCSRVVGSPPQKMHFFAVRGTKTPYATKDTFAMSNVDARAFVTMSARGSTKIVID